MKRTIALLGAVAALALSASASAASFLFTFSGDGGANGASGTLEATDNGNGSFTATSGTITAFGPVASGSGALIANPNGTAVTVSPAGYFSYDDQLLPGQDPLTTNGGLLFNIGGFEINIYSNGPEKLYTIYSSSGANADGAFALSQVSTAAVPEPATWVMMLAGFGMVGAGLRSRKRATVRVTYA